MKFLSRAARASLPLLTVLMCLLGLAGCLSPHSGSATAQAHTSAKAPAAKTKKDSPPPAGISGAVQGATMSLPDLKYPGKLLCEVHFDTASGQSADNGFLGNMSKVYAQLYQQGKPAATLTAPKANGSSLRKTVVVTATGGVVVKSQVQPGTRLQADTVVWYASLNKFVATGHVFFRDGKSGATMTGPKMVADTKLKAITIVSGHASASL